MKKVICPGEALIDFVSMDIGKTLKATDGFIKKAGGAPANVAAAISKLGAEAYFCGTVGDDAFGGFLEDTLNNNNINTELLFKIKNNTTFAFVSLMENGEMDFEFARDADECLTFDMISDRLEEFDLYHFGSATAFMGGNLKDTYFKLKEYAKSNNKIISFDANYVGCENLMVTLGKEGTLLSNREKQILIKTKEVKMKDATGAGDAFIGAVIAQILNEPGKSMEKIVEMANLVGGITTTKLGALESIPTWDEVFAYN